MAEEISLQEYKQVYREIVAEESRIGFIVHLVVYILVNALFITINTTNYYQPISDILPKAVWFHYPLLGWLIGIIMHYLFGVRWLDFLLKINEARTEYRMLHRDED